MVKKVKTKLRSKKVRHVCFLERYVSHNSDFKGDTKKKKKKKKPKKKKIEQTDPPRVGLSKFFPSGIYPEGEIQPYKDEYVILPRPPTTFLAHFHC